MKKIYAALITCVFFTGATFAADPVNKKNVPAPSASVASPTAYTADQKKELLSIVEVSANMFGYAKAALWACPTQKVLLDRYDAALSKYQVQINAYSFGKEAQAVYDKNFKAAYLELSAKMQKQDKTEFCAQLAPQVEPTILNLEKSLADTANVKEPISAEKSSKKISPTK